MSSYMATRKERSKNSHLAGRPLASEQSGESVETMDRLRRRALTIYQAFMC
jgi:hypothetical protein